jgi:hypothetical protein
MDDKRFQELLNADLEGVPQLGDLTKEMMRGSDVPAIDIGFVRIDEPSALEAAMRNTNDIGLSTGVLAADFETAVIEDKNAVVYSSVQCTDLPTAVTNFGEACQSGPNDWTPERRTRDRSGTAPKKRKWKDRAKAKAARKARRHNR